VKPLAIDLYCGLGGWADGLLAEGYHVIGFDVERHQYGDHRYPAQLVIQDVRTLHGSQFKDAALIVASPPCQAYSYRAMPWKRAKALAPPDNTLFETCFRIQREACEAAGRHVPLIVENVRGAQKWVGRARWNYGSFYLWGDVPALMPTTLRTQKFNPDGTAHGPGSWFAIADSKNRGFKSQGMDWSDRTKRGQDFTRIAGNQALGTKNNGGSWFAVAHNTTSGKGQNPVGRKVPGGGADGWFGENEHPLRQHHSGHRNRKAASAMIAKIPLPLSRHIAAVFRSPRRGEFPGILKEAVDLQ
jgi:C-5 cytosine-specific DNA methylase